MKKKLLKSTLTENTDSRGSFFLLLKTNFIRYAPFLVMSAFIILITFANSLPNKFVSDDIPAIVNNQKIYSASDILSRPNVLLKATTDYVIVNMFDKNPVFFRMVNIIYHIGTTFLLFVFLSVISTQLIATLAAIIFAVHPLISETVVWISALLYVQYSFFFLISIVLYYYSKKNKWIYLSSLFFFILSVATSEKAIVLSIAFPVFEYSFGNIKTQWKKTLPFILISGLWALLLFGVLGYATSRTALLNSAYYQETNLHNPLIQIPTAISSYLFLFFWPKNLSFYHSDFNLTYYTYIFRIGVSLMFVVAAIFSAKKNKFLFFFLCLFLISISPSLTPLPVAWVVAERYVYLGTACLAAILGYVISKLFANLRTKYIAAAIFILVIIALMTRTVIRNTNWKNQDTLWIATVKTDPSDPKIHNNLGDMYGRHGNFEKAIEEFKRAIELKPNYADAYHNLANTYVQINEFEKAVASYQKAISINPFLWQSHQQLAALYFNQKKFNQALVNINKALKINQQSPNLYTMLGVIAQQINDLKTSESAFRKALEIDPQFQPAINGLKQIQASGK